MANKRKTERMAVSDHQQVTAHVKEAILREAKAALAEADRIGTIPLADVIARITKE
jgi:hypothetical protein